MKKLKMITTFFLIKKKKEMENYVQIVLINFLLIMQKECVQIVIILEEDKRNLGIVHIQINFIMLLDYVKIVIK